MLNTLEEVKEVIKGFDDKEKAFHHFKTVERVSMEASEEFRTRYYPGGSDMEAFSVLFDEVHKQNK